MENLKNRSAVIVTLDDLNEMSINAGIEALKRFKEIENEGKVYNTHQAAKLLGKHFNTVKNYVRNGTLKTNAAGLISHSDIMEFCKERKRTIA